MRCLVTGATGWIGGMVARALAERGDDVVALVRDPERARELLPAAVETVPGDVTDPASCDRAVEGAEAILSCMGLNPVTDAPLLERVNTRGAGNVARAARASGARRLVHLSTARVFDAPRGGTLTEERLGNPARGTAYVLSKRRAERLVLAEAGDGLEVTIVCPAAPIGAAPDGSSPGLTGLLRAAVLGKLRTVFPGGMAISYIDDIVAAHLAALEGERPAGRYLVADGYATGTELCAAAVEHAGRGTIPRPTPRLLARVLAGGRATADRVRGGVRPSTADMIDFPLREVRVDSSRARRDLGVEPTPWRQAVRLTVDWLERERLLR